MSAHITQQLTTACVQGSGTIQKAVAAEVSTVH
jgi:hypothetical protein